MAFNPLQNYLGGLGAGQQQADRQNELDKQSQIKQLSGTLSQSSQPMLEPEFQKLVEVDPARAKQIIDVAAGGDALRANAMLNDAKNLKHLLNIKDFSGAENLLSNRKRLIQGDSGDTDAVLGMVKNQDYQGAMNAVDSYLGLFDPNASKGDSAFVQEWEELTSDLTPTEKALAKKVKLRLVAGAVGSSAQTISQNQGLTNQVAKSEAAITGAKEGAKLMEEFKLKPKIAYEVGLSTARAAEIADTDKENRSNGKALNVFETGMKSLVDAFDEGGTGAIVGRLPALTSDQQKMDGAISLMAPLVKQVFRSAGEGVFTDKDQELLMGMLPTRKDNKETVDFKIKNIYEIINQKLGQQGAQPAPQPISEADIMAKYGLN